MPRHCFPWILAAAIAAIGFQALQNRVVRIPDAPVTALRVPAVSETAEPASYAY
jgi:hypothetical protein